MCTPTTGDMGYPWNCRNLTIDDVTERLENFAVQNCGTAEGELGAAEVTQQVADVTADLFEDLGEQLAATCESLDGYWVYDESYNTVLYGDSNIQTNTSSRIGDNAALLTGFYSSVFGGSQVTEWGTCYENTTMVRCLAYNDGLETEVATYDLARDECTFTSEWYRKQCEELLGGYYENSVCYVAE